MYILLYCGVVLSNLHGIRTTDTCCFGTIFEMSIGGLGLCVYDIMIIQWIKFDMTNNVIKKRKL